MRSPSFKLSAVLAAALIAGPGVAINSAFATPAGQAAADNNNDSQIQESLTKTFSKSRYQGVQASVQNGVVTLTGTVSNYATKEDADKAAHHTKKVTAVRNDIQVGGTEVSDRELQEKLLKAIEYDRVGYGTTAFNAISVSVENGVVTLGGHAYGPTDKSSAISVASYMPGVKDVIDDIQVDPVSPMDDEIRIRVARAIYGYPSLNKYAIDPVKSIRISVQNGHVTLFGQVDTQADKDTAFIRANGVPGTFKVTNDLVVANQQESRR
ncbi:MAG TPA: BON domain-containing protein [Acidisarcina sp.]